MNRTHDPDDLGGLAERAAEAFRAVHRRAFAGDPAANSRLAVEVVEPAVVDGVPTLVLITPWTLNGLLFPPEGMLAEFPARLVVAGQARDVHAGELEPLGAYRSVSLVPDVSGLTRPEQARTLAHSFVEPFHSALRAALHSGIRPADHGELAPSPPFP